MKTYGNVYPRFLDRGTSWDWSASRPSRFSPGERAPGTQWIGGWVDPRAGLDDTKKRKFLPPPGLELRSLGRPARSQLLYRLRYPMYQSIINLITCTSVIIKMTQEEATSSSALR
jgi:hypothetical protein